MSKHPFRQKTINQTRNVKNIFFKRQPDKFPFASDRFSKNAALFTRRGHKNINYWSARTPMFPHILLCVKVDVGNSFIRTDSCSYATPIVFFFRSVGWPPLVRMLSGVRIDVECYLFCGCPFKLHKFCVTCIILSDL